MIYAFLIFVALFAIIPHAKSRVDNVAPVIARVVVALAVISGTVGIMIQVATYGLITAPCCQ